MPGLNSFLFLAMPFFGWSALRTLLQVTNLVYLLPFSFVLGLSAYLMLLYGLAFFLGIQKGALAALLLLFFLSLLLFILNKKDFFKIENPLKNHQMILLGVICLFISFFTYLLSNKWIIFDFKFHISVASYFVSSDKFPQAVSNWPTLFIPYHYGFNLLSATVAKLANISVIDSFHMIVIFSSVTTFLSCFAISYFFQSILKAESSVFLSGLFGGLFFYFAGNLLWLDAIFRHLLKIPPVENAWTLFQSYCALGMHGSIINDIGSAGILFTSSTLGIQLFLLLLFLYFLFLNTKTFSVNHLIFIFITSLSLFHVAEWILYLFLLAVFLSPFLSFLLKDNLDFKSYLIKNIVCFSFFIFIILFNSFAYKILSKDYSYLPNFLELSLNPNLFSLRAFGRFGNLNEHRNINLFSWDFISEFGFQFIFSAFVVYWLIKNKFQGVSFILSFLLVSFISPFLLYIKSSPPDVLRLFHPGFELLSLLFAFWIFNIREKTNVNLLKPLLTLFSFTVILPAISTLVLSGVFSPAVYLSHPFIGFVNFSISELMKTKDTKTFYKNVSEGINILRTGAVISEADIKAGNYLKNHLKENKYGISYHPLPFDYAGIPCYSLLGSSLPRRITFITLLNTLDPHLLKELKIKWLYLDPDTSPFVDLKFIEELLKQGFLKEVLALDNPLIPDTKLKLLEFVDIQKYIETSPRKAYWTFFTYLGADVIPVYDSSGQKTLCLFKSEKEATDFLFEQLKVNLEFKSYKPIVNAAPFEVLKQQAEATQLGLRFF